VSWRRWEVLAAAGGAVAAVGAAFAWNAWRKGAEAERFFRRFPDTVFDGHGDMPVGELVKITGVSSLSIRSTILLAKINQPLLSFLASSLPKPVTSRSTTLLIHVTDK
jgi:hypothetical protein